MKKILLIALLALTQTVSAQSGLSGALSKLFGGKDSSTESSVASSVGNVLGSLLGNSVTLSEKMLQGTWSYNGTACVLESDAALANIGGTVATTKIEDKLDGYLSKVGVKEGVCSFTFIDNDSCVFKLGNRELAGNYILDSKEKTIKFTFYGRLNISTHVAYNVTSMSIVFNADKLLSLIQAVTSKVSSSESLDALAQSSNTLGATSSTLGMVSKLLENYDGMMLGMKLKK